MIGQTTKGYSYSDAVVVAQLAPVDVLDLVDAMLRGLGEVERKESARKALRCLVRGGR